MNKSANTHALPFNGSKRVTTDMNGDNVYYLGIDADGVHLWLEQARFESGTDWTIGHVESYTRPLVPSKASDITSHTHFDSMLNRKKYATGENPNIIMNLGINSPLTVMEQWKLTEYMTTLYRLQAAADLLRRGHCNYSRECDTIEPNMGMFEEITQKIMPLVLDKLHALLTP